MIRRLLAWLRHREPDPALNEALDFYNHRGPLTPRQYQVLRALAETGSMKGAAGVTGLSPNTVKAHVRDAYLRLGVHSRIDAYRAMGWLRRVEAFPGTGLTLDADIWSRK